MSFSESNLISTDCQSPTPGTQFSEDGAKKKRKLSIKCGLCTELFFLRKHLEHHMVTVHEVSISTDHFVFENETCFLTGKTNVEKNTCAGFVQNQSCEAEKQDQQNESLNQEKLVIAGKQVNTIVNELTQKPALPQSRETIKTKIKGFLYQMIDKCESQEDLNKVYNLLLSFAKLPGFAGPSTIEAVPQPEFNCLENIPPQRHFFSSKNKKKKMASHSSKTKSARENPTCQLPTTTPKRIRRLN